MNIHFYNRTFGNLKEGSDLGVEDPYHIMSSLNDKMREAILNNPSGYKDDETCQILALDGKRVVGACNAFQGRMRAKGEILSVQNGSYLYAHEDYRKNNVGGDLFMRISQLHPNKDNLFAGISQMALGLYKAMKYTVFEFPRMIYLRKSKSVVNAYLKNESFLTYPIIWLLNLCLWLHRHFIKVVLYFTAKGYVIEEEIDVPEDVEKIVLSDEHPYSELHDKSWFEWNLNYSISSDPRMIRRLFVIKNMGKIEAFFLTKQEFFEKASSRGFKNVYLGSVMEWGISKESKLTEAKLYLMSIDCFDSNVDGIQVASDDMETVRNLRRNLFVGIGTANIGFKLKSVKDSDVKDIKNWRIRIAASDTSMN